MDALPILYSFRRCPYAMRARLTLWVSGQRCEIREIVLRDKPQEMLASSPKGTVPVLVLPDGTVVDESLYIMRWALAQNDPEEWLEGVDEALIAQNDSTFKHHLDRYKYHTRYDSDPIEHRDACMDMLAVLEARLARHANLCRKDRSLTDMAIMPFIRQFAATDREWFAAQPLPYVHKWLACHETSDIFRAIMIKLEPWRVGDAPIEFSAP